MTFPFKTISKTKAEGHSHTPVINTDGDYPNQVSPKSVVSIEVRSTTSQDITVPTLSPTMKKRYRIIDESTLSPEEAERLLIKRAYNRECADRARKRTKATILELQLQIKALHADKGELRQQVVSMEQEVQRLKEKNGALRNSCFGLTVGKRLDAYQKINHDAMSSPLLHSLHHARISPLSMLPYSFDEESGRNMDQTYALLLQHIRK